MYLPSQSGVHATRALHRGRHFDSISEGLAVKMDDIVKLGQKGDWTTQRYNEKLMELLQDTRAQLKQGKPHLNRVKKCIKLLKEVL